MQNNKEKTEIVRISKGEANDILLQYHYLGKVGSGISYAVLLGGEIESVAVFSNTKTVQGVRMCELSRFVLVKNEKNLASKYLAAIFSHIKGDYDAIISYSDEVVGHTGVIYKAIGAVDLGKGKDVVGFELDGRIISGRNVSYALVGKEDKVKPVRIPGKHKFLMILNKEKQIVSLLKNIYKF